MHAMQQQTDTKPVIATTLLGSPPFGARPIRRRTTRLPRDVTLVRGLEHRAATVVRHYVMLYVVQGLYRGIRHDSNALNGIRCSVLRTSRSPSNLRFGPDLDLSQNLRFGPEKPNLGDPAQSGYPSHLWVPVAPLPNDPLLDPFWVPIQAPKWTPL